MIKQWRSEARTVILITVTSGLIGLIVGFPFLVISIVLLIHAIWSVRQIKTMEDWLSNHEDEEYPPEAKGIWGDVFDQLYIFQRKERQTRETLQTILDRAQESTNALNEGVISIDHDGNLEWWNESASRLLGLRYPSDAGQPIVNLIRDPHFTAYFKKKSYQTPLAMPSPVSSNVTLEIQITLFGQDDHLMIIRDITRIRQLEKMRTDFVANVSHEMRTPLTVVKGYLETFTDNLDNLPRPFQRGVQQMTEQSNRMEALVNDLLTLSKLETNPTETEKSLVDVPRLLHALVGDAVTLSGEKQQQIDLQCDEDLLLEGIEKELLSAFSNLVTNAIKYTGEKSHIQVRWWQDAKGVFFEVEDDGEGIPAQHLGRLTERFYRVDSSRATATGGTGLGLAIVKHVLLRHEGQLKIASEVGKGSTFTCHFPPSRSRTRVNRELDNGKVVPISPKGMAS